MAIGAGFGSGPGAGAGVWTGSGAGAGSEVPAIRTVCSRGASAITPGAGAFPVCGATPGKALAAVAASPDTSGSRFAALDSAFDWGVLAAETCSGSGSGRVPETSTDGDAASPGCVSGTASATTGAGTPGGVATGPSPGFASEVFASGLTAFFSASGPDSAATPAKFPAMVSEPDPSGSAPSTLAGCATDCPACVATVLLCAKPSAPAATSGVSGGSGSGGGATSSAARMTCWSDMISRPSAKAIRSVNSLGASLGESVNIATNPPLRSAVARTTGAPSSNTDTRLPGPARPATRAAPSGSIRTTSNVGGAGGGTTWTTGAGPAPAGGAVCGTTVASGTVAGGKALSQPTAAPGPGSSADLSAGTEPLVKDPDGPDSGAYQIYAP